MIKQKEWDAVTAFSFPTYHLGFLCYTEKETISQGLSRIFQFSSGDMLKPALFISTKKASTDLFLTATRLSSMWKA